MTVKVSGTAKPVESAKLTIEQRLDRLEAENVSLKAENEALKAKPSGRTAKVQAESPFTAEDVLSMVPGGKNYDGIEPSWWELTEGMYQRKANGEFIPTITKSGGTRVTMKPGFDYGMYRFIKGVRAQMLQPGFSGLTEGEGGQIEALRNALNYCAEHGLIQFPEGTEAPVVKKAGRPRKAAVKS